MRSIDNEDLRVEDIPEPDATWDALQRFALTFDGYGVFGDACGEIANARRHTTLSELRGCLFFEQRRHRHFGDPPGPDDLRYLRSLVDEIRRRVADRR